MTPILTRHGRWLPHLAGLRALAALLVVVHHYFRERYPIMEVAGRARVVLFFVLSGFFITRMLLSAREQMDGTPAAAARGIAAFYVRRFLRLAPLLYVGLALMWMLADPDVRNAVWWHVGFASNLLFWRTAQWPPTTSHLWSLGVEMQFYLIWPLLVWICRPQQLRPVLFTCVAVVPAIRVYLLWRTQNSFSTEVLPVAVLDAFALGGLVLIATRFQDAVVRRFIRNGAIAAFACLVVSVAVHPVTNVLDRLTPIVGDTLLALIACEIVTRGVEGFSGGAGRVFASAPMQWLGQCSYGIYLWHLFMPAIFYNAYLVLGGTPDGFLAIPYWPSRLSWLAGTVALAGVTWVLVERPAMRLSDRASASIGRRSRPAVADIGGFPVT